MNDNFDENNTHWVNDRNLKDIVTLLIIIHICVLINVIELR